MFIKLNSDIIAVHLNSKTVINTHMNKARMAITIMP